QIAHVQLVAHEGLLKKHENAMEPYAINKPVTTSKTRNRPNTAACIPARAERQEPLLTMQALHPGSLTGVANHSRYEQDALGRLAGTIRWLTVTTFGSHSAVAGEAKRVNRMHKRVTGEYQAADGEPKPYRAADPDLLLWVHIAFMDSFLRCHQMYAWRAIPVGSDPDAVAGESGADAYVRLWSKSVAPIGLLSAPMNERELVAEIERYKRELVATDKTLDVVRFIRKPPLPTLAKPTYNLLFEAAVLSLPIEFRELLGLKAKPRWLIQPFTRGVLRFIRLAIGPESPIEDGAVARLRRIGAFN
ncbi:MAG: oxygenase MpaB family protein, partial [Rhodoluna sp.]